MRKLDTRAVARTLPALLVLALLALAAAAPDRSLTGPAPPPKFQWLCGNLASAVTGDSALQIANTLTIEQAIQSGLTVASCSLRADFQSTGTFELRAWDPTTLAPDPAAIALRSDFFDLSRIIWAGFHFPRLVMFPPVVTQSLPGVAEPPASQVVMRWSLFAFNSVTPPVREYFNPDGPESTPAGSVITTDSVRHTPAGNHPVFAHAVCAGDDDLGSLRVVQSVNRTDVETFPMPREFLQLFRVPAPTELRWVEMAVKRGVAPYFSRTGDPDQMSAGRGPTVMAILDGVDMPLPVPNVPASLVEARMSFDFNGEAGWCSHQDLDRTVVLQPHHDYWIWVRETGVNTFFNRRVHAHESAEFRADIGPYFARTDTAGPWTQATDQVLAFHIIGKPLPDLPVLAAPPPASAPAFAVRASPNPAPGSVRVDWSGAVGPVRFQVMDARGRVVSEGAGGAAGSWTWPGIDRSGRAVASGIYFVHARDSQGGHAVQRAVVVR